MKFGPDMINFGDALTFHSAPPSGQNLSRTLVCHQISAKLLTFLCQLYFVLSSNMLNYDGEHVRHQHVSMQLRVILSLSAATQSFKHDWSHIYKDFSGSSFSNRNVCSS